MDNFVGALALLAALTRGGPSPECSVVVAPKAALCLEVAGDALARERGLMYRTTLAPHAGMLFVFDAENEVVFWMKNTLVPLDMVFVRADGVVRSVSANVPATRTDTPDARIPRRRGRARFVIELPAGEAARDGIVPGTVLPLSSFSKALDARATGS